MAQWELTDTMNWIIDRCMKDPAGHPSGLGLLFQESDIPDEKTDWDGLCLAMETLIGDHLVSATPKHVMGSGGVAFWQPVQLTRSAFLKFKGAS